MRPGLAPAGDQGCSREERILRKPLLDGDPSSLWSAPHVDCLLRVWGEQEGEARQEGSCRWDPTGPAHRCTRGLCRPHRCVSGLLPPAHDGHPPSFLHFITESFTCTIRTLQCAPASSGVSCSLRHPLGFGCELVIMEHPVLAVLLSGGFYMAGIRIPRRGHTAHIATRSHRVTHQHGSPVCGCQGSDGVTGSGDVSPGDRGTAGIRLPCCNFYYNSIGQASHMAKPCTNGQVGG